MKLILPIQLECLETNYGHFIMNPIGDNYFVFSPKLMKKMDEIMTELTICGDAYIDLRN